MRHQPDRLFERGTEAIASKQWDEVETIVESLRIRNHHDHANLLVANYYTAINLPQKAIHALNAINQFGPFRERATLASAVALIELGETREALRLLQILTTEFPNNADGHRQIASLAYDLGQLPVAVKHLDEIARIEPTDSRPLRLKGLIYKSLNLQDELEAAYTETIRRGVEPSAVDDVAVEFGEALVQAGKYAEALEALAISKRTHDEPAKMLAIRVEALRGLGQLAEARTNVERGLKTHPNEGELHRLQAQLYLDDGNTAAALQHLEEATRLQPQHYQSHYLLAQAYSTLGRSADAERLHARANAIRDDNTLHTRLTREAMERPWDAGVRRQLAEIAERSGNPKLAEVWRAAAAACERPPR